MKDCRPPEIAHVEDVIDMDVSRSYTCIEDVDKSALTNILRTYAFFN